MALKDYTLILNNVLGPKVQNN